MRRVVTGHDAKGRSVFVKDDEPPRYMANRAGGFGIGIYWSIEETPVIPAPGGEPTTVKQQYFPGPGGSRFLVVEFLPESVSQEAVKRGVDPAKATEEFFDYFPGLGGLMEEDAPGMHASDTIDYGVVLSGEVVLELDDGVEKTLRAGDVVVQNGTRHRWQNRAKDKCVMVFSVVGAHRK